MLTTSHGRVRWRHLLYSVLLLFATQVGFGQATTYFTEQNRAFKRAQSFYDRGLYGQAMSSYRRVLERREPVNEPEFQQLRAQAEFGYAAAAVRRGLPEGEELMLSFIRQHQPDPLANMGLIEVANYYYNDKKYEKAVEFFNLVPTYQLTAAEQGEVEFKKGYANFVQQKFSEAKRSFDQVKDIPGEYYYPTNYYLGLVEFFEGRYDRALQYFRLVEKDRRYQPHVPYYIAQILFAEGKLEELIAYATPLTADRSLRKRAALHQLIGQAYFERGDYAAALPYLEYYNQASARLTPEEFYQLAFVQYRAGQFDKAATNFEEISDEESELGQHAVYYLADAQLKNQDKAAARNAFAKATRLTYAPVIQEEAQINYAKLSYELGYDREAITALQGIRPGTKYYNEAQRVLSDIFLNTRDYDRALNILRSMPSLTPQLQEAYQRVSYLSGIQAYQAGQSAEAERLLQQSNDYPVDARTRALAAYWLGQIAYERGNYPRSTQLINQFLTLAKGQRDLPANSSVYTANYTQGYNYLKQGDYNTALGYFRDAVSGIRRDRAYIDNTTVTRNILGDATLRVGDGYFKRNRYDEAVNYYDEAISARYSGYVYALYQKALVEGLRNNDAEKILALEDVVRNHPKSKYADDALFALGQTYQQRRDYQSALQPYKDLIQRYGNTSDLVVPSLLQLGLISYNLGSLNTSINYYKQVLSNNPEPEQVALALQALEEIYVNDLGNPDEYFDFLETVPGYKSDNTKKDSLNFRAAEVKFENAQYDQAVGALTDYINKFPNGLYLLQAEYYRGDSYLALKQYGQALKDYDYVINRGQSRYYPRALEKAALIAYNHAEDFNKAYEYYSQLEEVAGNDQLRFEAQLGAMRSAYRTNNTAAVRTMATKVAGSPTAKPSDRATANFYLGKLAYDAKDYDTAAARFGEVIQTSDAEQTAEARYLLAEIEYQRRNLDAAETLADQAVQGNGAYPYWVAKSLLLLADIFTEKGDDFNARAVLEALLENYRGDETILADARRKLAALDARANANSRVTQPATNGLLELDDSVNQ